MHFSHDYGFGNVDALAAVRLAETWTKQQTFDNEFNGSISHTPSNTAIGNLLTDTITFSASQQLIAEHVEVTLDLDHNRENSLYLCRQALFSPGEIDRCGGRPCKRLLRGISRLYLGQAKSRIIEKS